MTHATIRFLIVAAIICVMALPSVASFAGVVVVGRTPIVTGSKSSSDDESPRPKIEMTQEEKAEQDFYAKVAGVSFFVLVVWTLYLFGRSGEYKDGKWQ